MKSQMQNQEPHAEHHFAYFFEPLLIWGSIGWPLKCKLMGFFGHMLLSRAPPPCVVLCQGPEVNFPGHPWVTKLFCIGSPLNRSRSLTYCIGKKTVTCLERFLGEKTDENLIHRLWASFKIRTSSRAARNPDSVTDWVTHRVGGWPDFLQRASKPVYTMTLV